MITVREATRSDVDTWLPLRRELWPESTEAQHRKEVEQLFEGESPWKPLVVLFAEDPAGRMVGFVEVSVRPFAEGCRTNRVGYLEGWFVAPEIRETGVGKALITAAESWARAQGCTEFASDADPNNELSRLAHQGVGFTDVGLVRCFQKDL